MKRAALVLSCLALVFALASPARSADRAAEPDRPRPVRVGLGMPLTLLKVEERSITVKLVPTDKGGPTEQTLAVDKEKTRVRVGEGKDREQGDGTHSTTVKLRPGKLSDLKVGQKVKVLAVDNVATDIMIDPQPSSSPKEGDGKKAEDQKEKKAGDEKADARKDGEKK
jgi:hypothetical protein